MNIKSMIRHSLAVFTEKSIQKFKDKIMELDVSRAKKHEYLEYMAQKISEKMDRNKANGKPLFKFDAEKYAEVPKPTIIKPPEAFINGQKVRLKDIWDTPISQIKRLVIEFY